MVLLLLNCYKNWFCLVQNLMQIQSMKWMYFYCYDNKFESCTTRQGTWVTVQNKINIWSRWCILMRFRLIFLYGYWRFNVIQFYYWYHIFEAWFNIVKQLDLNAHIKYFKVNNKKKFKLNVEFNRCSTS